MKKSIWFCVIFLNSLVFLSLSFKIIEDDDSNTLLNTCSSRVIENFFGKDELLYFVFENDDINHLPLTVSNPRIVVNMSKADKPTYFKEGHIFIIYINSYESLKMIVGDLFFTPVWNERASSRSSLLIITDLFARRIYRFLWNFHLIYAAVLVYDSKNYTEIPTLYTADMHAKKNRCGAAIIIRLDDQSCANEAFIKTIPKPLRKYGGCPVLYLQTGPWRDSEISEHASAILLTLSALTRLEISLQFKLDIPKGYHKSVMWDHRIIMQRSLKILGYYQTEQFEKSDTIAREDWVWIMPIPQRIDGLKIYFAIFQVELWIMLIIGFSLICLTWAIIIYYKKKHLDFSTVSYITLNVFSMTLFGNLNSIPNLPGFRFLLCSYIVFCMHMQTAYVSNLIKFQTIPLYERDIDNLRQLADSHLPIHASEPINEYYFTENETDNDLYNKIRNKLLVDNRTELKYLDELKRFNNFSLLMPLVDFLHCSRVFSNMTNKFLIDNSLTGYLDLGFDMLPGHYFLDTLNKVISILTESGLYEKSLRSVFASRANSLTMKSVTESGPVVLTLQHLYGVFIIFGFGITISAIIFIFELIVGWRQSR